MELFRSQTSLTPSKPPLSELVYVASLHSVWLEDIVRWYDAYKSFC
ncbi:MAG: hypothetical protein QW289_01490 [Sulfolobales archaeon]